MDVKIKDANLPKKAIDLALSGEWLEAANINRTILLDDDNNTEALNRLAKALMELGELAESREILCKVISLAPYNKIAEKNLARVDEMDAMPNRSKSAKKSIVERGSFIEDSGKSATVNLEKCPENISSAELLSGEQVVLTPKDSCIEVYSNESQFLGIVDRRIGRRLMKLISGGNTYEATLIGVAESRVSLMIRETYRSPGLSNVSSFPNKISIDTRTQLREGLLRSVSGTDLDDDGERGALEPAFDDAEWDE